MVYDMLRLAAPLIFEYDRKCRIQICGLMHAAFDFFGPEPGLLKYGVIWKKVYLCPCLAGLAYGGEQSVLQFDHRLSSLIPVMMDIAVTADFHIHIR